MKIVTGVILTLISSVLIARGADKVVSKSLINEIEGIEKLNQNEMFKLAEAGYLKRKKLQNMLIKKINHSASTEVRACCIYIMGEYKLEAGIPILSENILFIATGDSRRETHWREDAAVEALTKIGVKAIPTMIELIENDPDLEKRKLALKVIKDVQGQEVAEFIIQQAIKKQKDSVKKNRLKEALKLLDKKNKSKE